MALEIVILKYCVKEIEDLPFEVARDLFEAISKLEHGLKLTMPLSRTLPQIHRSLYELRLQDPSGSYRIFYFIKNHEVIYFVHAFKKKTQQTPKRNIELILKRLKEIK